MTEGLAAQISSIVRQQLADAHRLLGAMLARLDATDEVDLGGSAATPTPTKPAKTTPSTSTHPATVERKLRRHRATQRRATQPQPAASDEWPQLREALKAVIRERGLTTAEIGSAIGYQGMTVSGWIAKSHEDRVPGPRAVIRVREWLRGGAVVSVAAAAEDLPPFALSLVEQQRLAGHLSLGTSRELRQSFQVNEDTLRKAVAGEHLGAEVIERVRAALANRVAG